MKTFFNLFIYFLKRKSPTIKADRIEEEDEEELEYESSYRVRTKFQR